MRGNGDKRGQIEFLCLLKKLEKRSSSPETVWIQTNQGWCMLANVSSNRWILFENMTDAEDRVLWKEFSVSKPNMYIDASMRGNWDGVYRKYNSVMKRMARPLLSMLKGVCAKHKLPLVVKDSREPWQYSVVNAEDVNEDFLPNIKLEEYQIRAIRRCCKIECGIIDMPTGSGKGEIICGICKAIQCPTIILADQRVVVDQLKKRLELRDIAEEVGLFYAGKRPDGQMIVVGLIQSLNYPKRKPTIPVRKEKETDNAYQRRLKKYDQSMTALKTRARNVKFLQGYIKKAEMIIVDECDKAASNSFKDLFKFLYNGRRRYGFSATPIDPEKPVEAMVMQEHLGSVIATETRSKVLERGRIVPCFYKMLPIGLGGDISEASAYDIAYTEWLTENKGFHRLILGLCKRYPDVGTLILVDRKELGFALEKIINESGIESHFIYGETAKRNRDEILGRFEKREFNVLIGGKIINRGLDLAGGCENLIIAGGGKLQSDLIQKVGRALRKNKQGYSYIFDFLFRGNRYLYDHSKARLKAMVKADFDTQLVFPGGVIDGREFVDKKFRIDRRFYTRK